jgi:hypothetical protein
MNDKSGLEQLLDQLDHWRNFAAYKLEQRIDPLIGMCLPDILKVNLKKSVCQNIIPEFPFPTKKLLENDSSGMKESFRCDRIDYAAFCSESNVLYLVELKTDSTSVSGKQLDKLQKVAENSIDPDYIGKWVRLIADVAIASIKPRKYISILYELQKWKFISSIDGVIDAAITPNINGKRPNLNNEIPTLKDKLEDMKKDVICTGVTVVPVLIAPKLCIDNIKLAEERLSKGHKRHGRIEFITLGDAAKALSGHDDLQKHLKGKLEEWNNPDNLERVGIPSNSYLRSLKGRE